MLSARLETCPRVTFSGAGTAAVSAPLALSLCVPAVCGALSTSVPASAAVLGVRPLSSPPLCAAAAADSSYSATLQRYFKALIREASTENWHKYVFISVLFQPNLIESFLFEITCHRNNYRFIFCLKKSINCLPFLCYCHIYAKVSALLSPAVTFTWGHRCAQEHEACRKQDVVPVSDF